MTKHYIALLLVSALSAELVHLGYWLLASGVLGVQIVMFVKESYKVVKETESVS
jgi:hypothetical protein